MTFNGTFGLFDVSPSDLTAIAYVIRCQVARIWKAARRCSACLNPNDIDANFCQACGSRTSLVKAGKPNKHIDYVGISRRFQEFSDAARNKPYQRQKSALERQLSDFPASLSPPKCVSSCTSDDIIKFLIGRDKTGRTVVHSQSCPRVGCNCPSRLAAGSVDSLLGKLRAIFNNIGRSRDSNLVAHPRVKEYLTFFREVQAARAILPSQAVSLLFAKFTKLIDFLRGSIRVGTLLAAVNKRILVRDTVFFVVDFFTADSASELGRLLANQVFRLMDRKKFLLRLTLTNTTRGSSTSPFILEPFEDTGVCPVAWIEYYLSVCNLLHIVLDGGYFFRATDRGRVVNQKPFLGSAVNNRLRKHLTGAKLNCGETPHSF